MIETVPWRGYKFIASLAALDAGAPRPILLHREIEYPLQAGENLVGRDSDCDIALPFASVSRHHARIRVAPNGVTIVDLGSKNSTFVRGTRIYIDTDLRHGDEIRFGREEVRFLFTTDSTLSVEGTV